MKLSILVLTLCILSTAQQTPSPADTGLDYVLLNDTSAKTLWRHGIQEQVNVARLFLKQVVLPGSDVGNLVNFSDNFYLDVQNSTDPDVVAAKLVNKGHGGTAIFDAVVASAHFLNKHG